MADVHQRPASNGPVPMDRTEMAGLLNGRIGQRRPTDAPRPEGQPATGPPVAAAGPAAVPRLAGLPGELPVDWEVIEALQADVSRQLSEQDPDKLLEEADRRALARSLVAAVVADWATKYARGNTPLTAEQEAAIGTAVFNAMYRGGRLQSLLDEEGVEDVMVD